MLFPQNLNGWTENWFFSFKVIYLIIIVSLFPVAEASIHALNGLDMTLGVILYLANLEAAQPGLAA